MAGCMRDAKNITELRDLAGDAQKFIWDPFQKKVVDPKVKELNKNLKKKYPKQYDKCKKKYDEQFGPKGKAHRDFLNDPLVTALRRALQDAGDQVEK